MLDLGTLGGNYSFARALNDSGQVAGVAATAEYESHAFLWDRGVMIDFGDLGGVYSAAEAVNNAGKS